MGSPSINRHSIIIFGRNTTVSVEDAFWKALREIATWRGETMRSIIASIDAKRQSNLSSAIRLFVLEYFRDQLDQRGGIVGGPT
jgi:predicted DNA-binding ribbon-helix-helix protein